MDKDTFIVHDQHSLFVFMLARDAKQGKCNCICICCARNVFDLLASERIVNFISQVQVPHGNMPLLLSKGIVYCNTQNGRLNTVLLKSHKTETQASGKYLCAIIYFL